MSRKSTKPQRQRILVSLALSVSALVLAAAYMDGVDAHTVAVKILLPLLRLLLFIAVGLAAGQLVEASGWTRVLAALALPAFRYGRLGSRCSAAFTTAFFSGVAANAMLLDFFKDGKISRRQLFLANFVNQLPGFFLHLPTTLFVVIPLTRWAGALYFILTFAAALLRTAAFLVCGHVMLPPAPAMDVPAGTGVPAGPQKVTLSDVGRSIRRRLPARLTTIAVYVVPIYILVYLINAAGLFDWLRQWLAGLVVSAFIPVESLSVVVLSFVAEFTSGFAAAGALLDAGLLSVKQTAVALLLGNVLAFPIRALRHQLPHYMGIYSPKMGLQLLVMGQGFRVVSILLVGVLYVVFF
jgi:hypothetical protein